MMSPGNSGKIILLNVPNNCYHLLNVFNVEMLHAQEVPCRLVRSATASLAVQCTPGLAESIFMKPLLHLAGQICSKTRTVSLGRLCCKCAHLGNKISHDRN